MNTPKYQRESVRKSVIFNAEFMWVTLRCSCGEAEIKQKSCMGAKQTKNVTEIFQL